MNKLTCCVFLYSIIYAVPASDQPTYYIEKTHSIPDLLQTDKRAELPGGGTQYCGPVAVGNSLMWLDFNGFPSLVENSGSKFHDQIKLVKLLGSKGYMDTSLKNGTGTTKLMRGLRKYVQDRGYGIEQLEYQGWRKHPKEMKTKSSIPQLSWIKHGILGNGAVWLNVGWYKHNPSKDEYTRIGGHWVTLVGFGKDERGKSNRNLLILHDPSSRAGKTFKNEYAIVNKIHSGALVGKKFGLPRKAAGYYKLGGGMHIKKKADVAIIDGAISLKLKDTNGGTGISDSIQDHSKSINAGEAKKELSKTRLMPKGQKKNLKQ